jgi:TM2 domain-containing membrane protein YozV
MIRSAFGVGSGLAQVRLRTTQAPFQISVTVVLDLPGHWGNLPATMNTTADTHSKVIGYLLWLFGFTGSHRFYYGKPVSGTIWFFTLGLLLIGWLIDLFLIPSMDRQADRRFQSGPINYSVAWILLTFLGFFGIHRFYMGKWGTGLLYLLTFGLLGVGYLYDMWTLNWQISELNKRDTPRFYSAGAVGA